jgi:hypothetical protein
MTPQDLPRPTSLPKMTGVRPAAPELACPRATFVATLEAHLPARSMLQVVWTRNRVTLLSYRRSGDHVALRLHQDFAPAPAAVAWAIAQYIQGHKAHLGALDAFILTLQKARREAPQPAPSLRPVGHVHDLSALFAALNADYFHGRCTARITWGRRGAQPRRRRSMVLGSYAPEQHLIRIHPALDQHFVPAFVVAGVVYHEMLHEVFGVPQGPGRRRIHPPEFVAVEQLYPDYARCQAWERNHLGRLLAYKPSC